MTLDGNAVRSVDRAAALLLALGESHGEAGVTELARRLGLHKSTASRLLATLEKRGLVEQDEESGKYRLGLVVIRLAERAERTLDLRSIAMPELDRLARATRETTGLGVLDGDQLLTVAQADGPNLVAMGDWTGRCVPVHSVAGGKVLLASLPEREVLRLVRRGLDRFTDKTIVNLEPLLEELARVRRRGFATAFGEFDAGLNAVAAPVHDARGQVIAAVDVWGPAFRVTPGASRSSSSRSARRPARSRCGSAGRPPSPRPCRSPERTTGASRVRAAPIERVEWPDPRADPEGTVSVEPQAQGGPEIENLFAEDRTFPPDPAFVAQANATAALYDEADGRLRGVLGEAGPRAAVVVQAVRRDARVGPAVREVVHSAAS